MKRARGRREAVQSDGDCSDSLSFCRHLQICREIGGVASRRKMMAFDERVRGDGVTAHEQTGEAGCDD